MATDKHGLDNDPMIDDEPARWLLFNAAGWMSQGDGGAAVEGVANEGPYPISMRWLDGNTTGADSILTFLRDFSLTGEEVLRLLRIFERRAEDTAR